MSKQISLTGIPARNSALKGAFYVSDAVAKTLGPFGLNALLENGNKITNDGFLISSALIPAIDNEFERQGARTAQQASSKTNDEVGDATTTAWVLFQAIAKEAIRYLPNENNLIGKKTTSEIKQWIETSKNEVLTKLKDKVTPITTQKDLIKSALVSVENEEIANMLGSMQFELGPEGIIIAEEVNEDKTTLHKVKGIRLDNGFGTSMLINNPAKNSLELVDLPILLTNYVFDEKEINELIESIFKSLKTQKATGCILIGRAFTSKAIQICQNTIQSGFGIFPVNAPYTNQKQVMKDIEAVVGGRYIDTEETRLEDIYITDVGFCERFEARISDALVVGTDNEQATARITKRVETLKESLKGEQSDFYKKMIETRIAQITNGFALLRVGATSLVERNRLKDKCDDAVNSVRLALKGGTVKGAGQAFKEISEELTEDNVLKRPITAIYDQIVNSAPQGWEIPEWVQDPYLSLKSALENACDVAGTMASVNTVVTTANRKECHGNTETDSDS